METSSKLVTGDSPVGFVKIAGPGADRPQAVKPLPCHLFVVGSRLYEDVGAVSLIDSSGILTEELRLF